MMCMGTGKVGGFRMTLGFLAWAHTWEGQFPVEYPGESARETIGLEMIRHIIFGVQYQ